MSDVVDLQAERLRRSPPIRMIDLKDCFVAREAVAYGNNGNQRVCVFGHWEGEEIGLGLTADQARELGLALIGAAALATQEFRASVEQREEI